MWKANSLDFHSRELRVLYLGSPGLSVWFHCWIKFSGVFHQKKIGSGRFRWWLD
ncbi:hypothetical protein SLEP1_g32979 [Rubroshorea leprosula]|uniref:Uncharacterized protein n=1 Tax=Rubroshorea leprosula TaxID=152421 RepID=A0AAV5KF60_9ROSI|nr:hypothetical protein SLEP1_g32979 [Rubroshorea leprosula]